VLGRPDGVRDVVLEPQQREARHDGAGEHVPTVPEQHHLPILTRDGLRVSRGERREPIVDVRQASGYS